MMWLKNKSNGLLDIKFGIQIQILKMYTNSDCWRNWRITRTKNCLNIFVYEGKCYTKLRWRRKINLRRQSFTLKQRQQGESKVITKLVPLQSSNLECKWKQRKVPPFVAEIAQGKMTNC